MLVPGSEAAELLASMFTAEQQPHLALPTAIEPVTSAASGGGHRLLQADKAGPSAVRVTVKATAPTVEEVEKVLAKIRAEHNAKHLSGNVDESNGGDGGRRALLGDCDVQMAELMAEKDAELVKLAAEKDAEIQALRQELKKK